MPAWPCAKLGRWETTAKEQADQVGGEVVDQARTLADEARSELESQAHSQSRRLADTLSRLGDEVAALAEGRPDDADNLRPYVSDAATAVYDAADPVYGMAQDIDEHGVTAVLGDLQVFAWIIASAVFALYVANFASYNKTYGALGGVIIFLVWLWLSNIAVLLGAELNAELERGRRIEAGHPVDKEPFLEPRDTRRMKG